MQQAHHEIWPRLEKELKKTLIHPCSGLFFGPQDGLIQDYTSAVQEAGAQVEACTIEHAKKQFPQFSFLPTDAILLDHTAGVIAAEHTVLGLVQYLQEKGVTLLSHTPVLQLEGNTIITPTSTLYSDWTICCTGPWIPKLFPFLNDTLRPLRQRIFYMESTVPHLISIPHFPVWVEVGQSLEENWYGLPQFGNEGFKLARHRLTGGQDDPDANPIIQSQHREEAQEKARIRFPIYSGKILQEESCIYTMRDQENYLIDHHPQHHQIIIASGFSGHGFKLAPLCGELIVNMIEGHKTLSPFAYKAHNNA